MKMKGQNVAKKIALILTFGLVISFAISSVCKNVNLDGSNVEIVNLNSDDEN